MKTVLNVFNLMFCKENNAFNNVLRDFGKMNQKIYVKNATNSVLNAMEKILLNA
jgi:hypothetical protein